MSRPLAVIVLSLILATVGAGPAGAISGDLSGIGPTIRYVETEHYLAVARYHAAAIARAAQAARAQRVTSSNSHAPTTVSGSCASMAPPGFPGYIVWRESRGDPTARNPSGAFGCAQIMPAHFNSGGACVGLGYAACWSRLWAGGTGASNWSTG